MEQQLLAPASSWKRGSNSQVGTTATCVSGIAAGDPEGVERAAHATLQADKKLKKNQRNLLLYKSKKIKKTYNFC